MEGLKTQKEERDEERRGDGAGGGGERTAQIGVSLWDLHRQ